MQCHYGYPASSLVLPHSQDAQIRYWPEISPESGFVVHNDREEMVNFEIGNAALLPFPRGSHDVLLPAYYPHGSVSYGSAQRLIARLYPLQRRSLESKSALLP